MHAPPPPDGPGTPGGTSGGALSADEQAKARLDDTELAAPTPKAAQKVELDLDDAPFLEEEEAPPPAVEEAPPPLEGPDLDQPVKLPIWKNKKVVFGGGAGLLILLGLAVWWFFLRSVEPPKPVEPPPPPPIAEPPKPPEPPAPQDVSVPMDAFVVEKADAKGVVRVLTLKLKLIYKENPQLARELQVKNFSLRDGLYYNLKNKSFDNLTDKQSIEQIREELRGVVNNYLNYGQVEQLLFEELLVK